MGGVSIDTGRQVYLVPRSVGGNVYLSFQRVQKDLEDDAVRWGKPLPSPEIKGTPEALDRWLSLGYRV